MESRLRLVPQLNSVDDLYSCIQADPDIVEKIEVSPFFHTPLHDASAAGKIDIAIELMILKPSFAKKLNAYGYSPLHIAVENENNELALELVKCDPSLIRLRGRKEFLLSCPESIRDVEVNGKTALDIAVINERYEELKVLIGYMKRNRRRDASPTEIHVLNRCDLDGNTALHLAAFESNLVVLRELLSCMSLNRNTRNNDGNTALDVLTYSEHRNDIEKRIQNSGGKTKDSLKSKVKELSEYLTPSVNFWGYCSTEMARYRSNVSDGSRNNLLVIVALIITVTYQTAVQPEDTDEINKTKHTIDTMVTLWGYNNLASFLSIFSIFILLQDGRTYTVWYFLIMVPLAFSYQLPAFRKYKMYDIQRNDVFKQLIINMHVILIFVFLLYLLEFYRRWKLNKPKRVPEPKLDAISKGFKPWYRV